ncbi:MAG: serine/threonine-protein kinase [Kofleriaceae bacterium]
MAEGVSRAQPALPARIGRHSVLGYLADGGMAEIFLGREPEGRAVVIKRILPHLARQQNFVAMFIDEARIGSLVHHPNVVEVFELGQVGTDLFLVMEYLAGESTSGFMRRLQLRGETLPTELGAYIVAEACAGLQCAHDLVDESGMPMNLVHRDISLSNLFITYAGDVKVLDFGIAKAADRLTRTATGQVKGKFSYMSPEQCRGEPLDLRSDIFSLGVVLYELTTQRRLFKRANELMVLKAVTEQPIPRPTREIVGYPPALEHVVMKALSRDREQRWSSMAEMRTALLGVIGNGDLKAALAETMSRNFDERIAEKQALLRHIRANTKIDMVPASEVDESVEVPQMPEPSATLTPPVLQQPQRRRWLIPAIAIAAIAIGIGVFAAASSTKDTAVPAQADVVEMKPEPAAVPVPPAPPDFVVEIDSIPTGAVVMIDGRRAGVTPFSYKTTVKGAIAIELARDGYEPIKQAFDVEKPDERLTLQLVEKKKAPVTQPVKQKKSPTKKSDDPFKRFD